MDYKIKQVPEDFAVEEMPSAEAGKSGDYAYFWMKKKNYNTLRAVKTISDALRVSIRRIGWAGNKDKNAVTSQLISIQNADHSTADNIELKDISLQYFGQGAERIFLGNLRGNKFDIVVRNLSQKDYDLIAENCGSLRKNGFLVPNYFDEQRFGGNNLEIGKALLKQDFASAAELVYRRKAGNPIAELRKVHRSSLSLYLHAYQSLIFNELLSGHIERNSRSIARVDYKNGTFLFPRSIIKNASLQVIGFGSETDGECERILGRHGLTRRSFVIRQLPGLSVEGSVRSAFVRVGDFKLGSLKSDELNRGRKRTRMSFFLPKGSYATIVVRALAVQPK